MIARRTLLGAALAWPLAARAETNQLTALEASLGGRIGLAAFDTANGRQLLHRAQERFAFCSTFKVMAASAILKRAEHEDGLLDRHIPFGPADMVNYSPITSKHVGQGMALGDICAAALRYSDNSAANLMIRLLGGPQGVTSFARSIGDTIFRLDRTETALNTSIPGDPRDTTIPAAMLRSLRRLTLGNALEPKSSQQLLDWMRGCTTGDKRIRAGVPSGWDVAEKTGSGDYGAANDIGVIYPPGRRPILLLIYTVRRAKDDGYREDIIAEATRIALKALG